MLQLRVTASRRGMHVRVISGYIRRHVDTHIKDIKIFNAFLRKILPSSQSQIHLHGSL